MGKILVSMAAALFVFTLGCSIPTNRKSVVPEGVAETPEELIAKVKQIKKGASLADAVKFLNIKPKTPGVRFLVAQQQKQEALYGKAEVRGTPDELEAFRERLEKSQFIEISFIDTGKSVTIIPWRLAAKTTTEGEELVVYLFFYEGRFVKQISPDTFYKKESDTVYISDLLGSLFSAGASQGVRQIK